MTIRHFDEWDRKNTGGSTTRETHVWIGDNPPAPARSRTHDAAAGAIGEWQAGSPFPGGPQDPPQYGGRQDQFPGPTTTGGLPEASKNQGGEPAPQFDQPPPGTQLNPDEEAEMRARNNGEPMYVDARSLRISGRDQNGKMWNSHIWGPGGEQEYGGPKVEPDMARAGDRALRYLEVRENEHVAGLAAFQRALNAHYARR